MSQAGIHQDTKLAIIYGAREGHQWLEQFATRALNRGGRAYYRFLEFGLHLGYRGLQEGSGTWVARRWSGTGAYSYHRSGVADDFLDADADQILTFAQAQERVRAWGKAEGRKDCGLGPDDGPYTIEQACKDYLAHYVAKGGKSEYTVKLAINVHIIPALGKLEVAKLTTRRVREWHHGLAQLQSGSGRRAARSRSVASRSGPSMP